MKNVRLHVAGNYYDIINKGEHIQSLADFANLIEEHTGFHAVADFDICAHRYNAQLSIKANVSDSALIKDFLISQTGAYRRCYPANELYTHSVAEVIFRGTTITIKFWNAEK